MRFLKINWSIGLHARLRAWGPDLNIMAFLTRYIQYANDEGQPYFDSDLWIEGSVSYDGIVYENISMLYDPVEDELVIESEKDKNVTGMQMGLEKLDIKTMKKVPVVLGEVDILKVVLTYFTGRAECR